jgi:uncharacterized protein (DUF488 family)
MEIFTIGFTKKNAAEFFGILRRAGIRQLIDVRLNNRSQLASFTKKEDLEFFLKEICQAVYCHEPLLAPTQEILDAYKKSKGDWAVYEIAFKALLHQRGIASILKPADFEPPTALLCSEPTPEHCHRRLVAEFFKEQWGGVTSFTSNASCRSTNHATDEAQSCRASKWFVLQIHANIRAAASQA